MRVSPHSWKSESQNSRANEKRQRCFVKSEFPFRRERPFRCTKKYPNIDELSSKQPEEDYAGLALPAKTNVSEFGFILR